MSANPSLPMCAHIARANRRVTSPTITSPTLLTEVRIEDSGYGKRTLNSHWGAFAKPLKDKLEKRLRGRFTFKIFRVFPFQIAQSNDANGLALFESILTGPFESIEFVVEARLARQRDSEFLAACVLHASW